jgi:hypothetical protein
LAPHLTSAEELSKLDIEPGRNQLPLPLDPKFDNTPVFRKVDSTTDGFAISDTDPLPYGSIYWAMKTLGQITGFKQIARPYALRYGAGKAFNENGTHLHNVCILCNPRILTVSVIQARSAKHYKI